MLLFAFLPFARAALECGKITKFIDDRMARQMPLATAAFMFEIGAYQEAADIIQNSGIALENIHASLLLARNLFELERFSDAREAMKGTHFIFSPVEDVDWQQYYGQLEVLCGDKKRGAELLSVLAAENPRLYCPHQNLSARYSREYMPTQHDLECGADGLMYDAYNYLGQRVTHVGSGHMGVRLYAAALDRQAALAAKPVAVSAKLRCVLYEHGIAFDRLKILPWEWVTQIGHLGMLDVLLRMRDLGWWEGDAVVLAPRDKIANRAFLSLFERECRIFIPGVNVDEDVADELFSMQRSHGMAFNAWKFPDGRVVPWQEAGAAALCEFERRGLKLPLRDEYDSRLSIDDALATHLQSLFKRWGMTDNDWYVCLHMRDPAFYGEASGQGQSHRNADVQSYIETVRHITGRGGWVIKLGGANSPKFPPMGRVIDYAQSPDKREQMDIHLIRHARYFVGTTSGLTNVAISFGVPCALVNCITVDAQLWTSNVRFALKPVVDRNERSLTQREVTNAPWRWRLFGYDVMRRYGIVPRDNSPDEILETVREVERIAESASGAAESRNSEDAELIARWRASLGLADFYGAATPGIHFLKQRGADFIVSS